MAEWFKATVLKTVLGNTNVGSNPTATFSLYPSFINEYCTYHMMDVKNRYKRRYRVKLTDNHNVIKKET